MPDQPAPTRVRAQLALELRTARTLAGISQDALAQQIGRSQTFIARVERAERLLSHVDTVAALRALNAEPDVRDRVLALTEAAHADTNWTTAFGDKAHLQDEVRDEDRASKLAQYFQPSVLPGYTQTVDYARAVLRIVDGQRYRVEGVDQAKALAARIERQALLRETGRVFQFLITERLLRWEPEPGVLAPQLAQLLAVTQLDAVEVAVLPDDYAGAVPWHNFLIRHPADGSPPYVNMELLHGPHPITRKADVDLYLSLWERMWQASAQGDDARIMIREAAA